MKPAPSWRSDSTGARCAFVVGAILLGILSGCNAPAPASPAAPAHEWPFASGTLDGRRASLDPAVTAATLPTLGVAWVFPTRGAVTGTPTVSAGRAFVGTWQGNVTAIQVADGTLAWSHDVDAKVTGSVTLYDGLAVFGDSRARLHALDAATGAEVWNRTLDAALNAHLYATPLVAPAHEARGAIVIQAVGSDQESKLIHGENPITFRGSIVALNLTTGAEMWRTWLTPDGSTGAPVWGTPVLIPGMDLVVFGTGNAYTEPATPMTDAIVALRISDGAVAWSFQATKDDVFTQSNPTGSDDDFGSTPSIVQANGSTLVVIGQKSSVVWAIDALTGKVAWTTGLRQKGEGIIGDTAANEGLVFAPYVTLKKIAALDAETGAPRWNVSLEGQGFADPVAVAGAVVVGDTSGTLQGLEASTGRLLWSASVGEGGIYGGLSIAEGHLFVPVVRNEFLGDTGAVVAFAPGLASSPSESPDGGRRPGEVAIRGFEFVPDDTTIQVGENVTWTNDDLEMHTVTFAGTHASSMPERELNPTESARIFFDEPGTFDYYCRPHAFQLADGSWSGMTGTVVVLSNEPS